ncbi:MAG TPA: DevR family CRISPR-associated autoregulator [Anaerolineae bacterium]|nr:DevR family CRISPR-associated autoregulator [Anaerolineae bacterium]HUX77615.1 DevR family CRISPR-associated autoregulator [Anaerolineae bacterium]
MTDLYSLSISARATLDMHSLNNEGGEGNQIQTRMVNIVGQDGRLHNTNAVSGDMLKHILTEHYFRVAARKGLPLCAGCREFNANRIAADDGYRAMVVDKTNTDVMLTDELLQRCALDDVAGNLITEGGRSLPRKSVVEFGWMVGLPEITVTDSYFHVKYASERSEARRTKDASEEQRGANLQQAIFHRPASSGVYAIVAHVELARIGFNDITQQYVIDREERGRRYIALLESLLYSFLEPNGAMRGTQNPHILNVEGVVSHSSSTTPAPTISPLNDEYAAQIRGIAAALEPVKPGVIGLEEFGSLPDLTGIFTRLIQQTAPFELRYAGGS